MDNCIDELYGNSYSDLETKSEVFGYDDVGDLLDEDEEFCKDILRVCGIPSDWMNAPDCEKSQNTGIN